MQHNPIKTLDAIHSASLQETKRIMHSEEIILFSCDTQMNRCAKALGYATPCYQESDVR